MGRVGFALAVVVALGITLAGVIGGEDDPPPPPPDEDAYVAELFTSKWDVLLPKRPFIEFGYESCALIRAGHTDETAAHTMWVRDPKDYKINPVNGQAWYLEQTVAAHKHLCPDA